MKKLKEREDKVPYTKTKRSQSYVFILFMIIELAAVTFAVILKNMLIALVGTLSVTLFVFLYFTNKSKAKIELEKTHEYEFVDIINYFEMFLSNNMNIYQAFKEVTPYASPWMSNKIERLLEEIDEDKTVRPFINFSKNFKSAVIENVMISIYQWLMMGITIYR